ncbi:hypothetical protein AB5J62_23385 [Amycolatopsis sp. cg5]|uniref:hypothetical protein n=1 Tax=Amycolatopsis sp. cg5 TaxID=3238802 RepID=UPI003523CA59
MLTVPAMGQYDGITVYRDDTDFFRFYALPKVPRVRTDEQGKPVLVLVKYALSEQDRAAHPELGNGGGYLSLDTQFDLTAAEIAKLRPQLQSIVDSEWNRLRAGTPEERAKAGATTPQVQFATPTYTESKVKLDSPTQNTLLRGRVAEGGSSLLTGNVACFSLDLTPGGATLLEKELTDPKSDLTSLQVEYDLKFWARLPEVGIHLEVDASKMYSYVQKQLEGRGWDNCTSYDYDHSDITEESLTLSGAVKVLIDNSAGSVPEEVIAELRGYAFDTLKQLLQSVFFEPEEPVGTGGQQNGRQPNHRYFLKKFDSQSMQIRLDMVQRSVVPWSVAPRGTLTSTFGSITPGAHIREYNLDDPFFSDLIADVTVFSDFTEIGHAEVELRYAAAGKSQLLTFTTSGQQVWKTPLVDERRDYTYRTRMVFKNGKATPFSDWEAGDSNKRLAISLPVPGLIDIDVLAGAVDFDKFAGSVQIAFAYEDLTNGVPREEYTVVLTKNSPSAKYTRRLGTAQTKPVQYRQTFVLVNGERLADPEWRPVPGRQLLVNQPNEAVLRVGLMPVGLGWLDVTQVMVEVTCPGALGRPVTETVKLSKPSDYYTWVVPLADPAKRAYRYRWTASFTDGRLETVPWRDDTGDTTVLPIPLNRAGLDITVIGDALNFAACPLTEITLAYNGPSPKPVQPATFLFRDKTPQRWHIDVPDGSPIDLTATITHHPAGRDPVKIGPRQELDPMVVVPAYLTGELKVTVLGQLIDFKKTPLVAVDLTYSDPGNQFTATKSLTLSANQSSAEWVLATRNPAITTYTSQVTYYDTDGGEHTGPVVKQTKDRIVIPAYKF